VKLLWIELEGEKYFLSHLGLAGFWSFKKNENDRIRIKIENEKNGKIYYLCYQDPRNFGNMDVMIMKSDLLKKINALAMDALKEEFTDNEFIERVNKFLSVSSARKKQKIFLALMEQNDSKGIVSGLGNYLTPEILWRSRIDPNREVGSLSNDELIRLSESIKYVTKLSYYNNTTGYMTNFGDFIVTHKERIDEEIYPEYHKDIKLNKNDKFQFNVYQKKKDPFGNDVIADKTINKGRTTYWVKDIQK
jgi:formamidopyrimidine-DNA glycosylase